MRVEEKTFTTVLCSVRKKVQQKKKSPDKCIDNYIFIDRRVRTSRSVCAGRIVRSGRRGGSVRGGLGRLTVSQKNENGEKWHNFKTTVLANYSPRFRLLFTILNFSTSTFILVYS